MPKVFIPLFAKNVPKNGLDDSKKCQISTHVSKSKFLHKLLGAAA